MRRFLSLAMIAALVVVIPAGSAVAASPTITNGSFESGDYTGCSRGPNA